jgi:hypothetical protein
LSASFADERSVPTVSPGGLADCDAVRRLERLVQAWEALGEELRRGYEGVYEEWLNEMYGRQLIEELVRRGDVPTGLRRRVTTADREVRALVVRSERPICAETRAAEMAWTRKSNWWYWRWPLAWRD